MDDAFPILEYLPNSFREPGEQEYINFLWDAFASNYENEKYQFAMLPYHMLYMSFVYFSIWQIKLIRPLDFSYATIFQKNEKQVSTAPTPFTFHKVAEGEVFKFLRIIGCNEEQTRSFAALVGERNKLAHANGLIVCAGLNDANQKVRAILEQVEAIQQHMTPLLHECLKRFLLDSCAQEGGMQYDNLQDQIKEMLVHEHYFSRKDIEACRSFNIQSLESEPHFEAMQALFDEFLRLYPVEAEA